MIRTAPLTLTCIALLSYGPGLLAQSEVSPSTGDEQAVVVPAIPDDARLILDRSIEAMGGAEAMASFQSSRSTCHLELGELKTTLVMLTGKPNLFLTRHEIEGLGVMEMGFDGTQGWRKDPPDGTLTKIDKEEAIDFAERLDLQAMVRHPERTYSEISVLPQETFERIPCSILSMKNEDRSAKAYFDQETGLLKAIELVDPKARASNRRVVIAEWSDPDKMMPLRWVRAFRVEQPRETLMVTYDYMTFDDVPESTFIAPAELQDDRRDADG